MQIFISWSGAVSKAVAGALRDWLKRVLQTTEPWMSERDVQSGARWSDAVAVKLRDAKVGIICLTPENRNAPWLHFEAGALSKTIEHANVCPYLFGIEPHDLVGPLAQFQARRADKDGTGQLLQTLNSHPAHMGKLDDVTFSETFELWWPKLAQQLGSLSSTTPRIDSKRTVEDMVPEILETVRDISRKMKPSFVRVPIFQGDESEAASTDDEPVPVSQLEGRDLLQKAIDGFIRKQRAAKEREPEA